MGGHEAAEWWETSDESGTTACVLRSGHPVERKIDSFLHAFSASRRPIMNTRATVTADVPQTDAYYSEVPNEPCAIVMFGASGDLARRKLLPALYDLAVHACLAPRFRLLGYARTGMSDDDFRKRAGEFLPKAAAGDGGGGADGSGKIDDFLKHLPYFSGNYDAPTAFQQCSQRVGE